ncbi:hypothetical protein FOVSG1_014387 [Fusarium oxysporum f. sp. vasinfectum]
MLIANPKILVHSHNNKSSTANKACNTQDLLPVQAWPCALDLLPNNPTTLGQTFVKTFSNLLNSTHHPFAGARCSADSGGSADSTFEQ